MRGTNEMMQQAIELDDWAAISRELARSGTGIKIKNSLTVRDFMRQDPPVLTVNDSLQKAAEVIINHNIDGIPIVDEHGQLEGLVSKTLLLREMVNGTPSDTPLAQLMVTNPISVDPDENVSVLITVNIGNLPVVEKGRLVGIVTLSDTIRAYFSSLVAVREELHAILDAAYNGILTVNEQGHIVLANKAAGDFLRLPHTRIIGEGLDSVFGGTQIEDVLKTGRAVLGQKISYQGQIFIANYTAIKSNDEIIGAVAIFQDISDLEVISEELTYTKRMKEELDAIIESSFDGICVSDDRGYALRVNEAFTRIMSLERRDILGKHERTLMEEGIYKQPLVDMVLAGKNSVTFAQETKPGNNVVITANPVLDSQGKVFRVVTNFRDMTELDTLKQSLEKAQNLGQHYQDQLVKYQLGEKYVMRSKSSKDLLDLCIRLGQVDTTVLIQGESGVGKEIVAQIIHSNSTRSSKPMISINCAAIPENLMESELFGYTGGAFTGAGKSGKPGIFETADGGTLFLDEVGELPLVLQGKLLRALQQREITRVGSTKPIPINVRLLAATNRDLWEMVKRKEFRQDLYYRLKVVPIKVAPLRERKSEIPFFIAHFLKMYNNRYGKNKRLDEQTLRLLQDYSWPGNVRELENLIERLVVTHPGDLITCVDLEENDVSSISHHNLLQFDNDLSMKKALEQLEKQMLEQALETYGTTRRAASVLGISQPTVVRKAARYGINLGHTLDD